MVLRILLGIVLFWAILRFFKILALVFTRPKPGSGASGPQRPQRARVRDEKPSLKTEEVIDVDYTESTSKESNKDPQ